MSCLTWLALWLAYKSKIANTISDVVQQGKLLAKLTMEARNHINDNGDTASDRKNANTTEKDIDSTKDSAIIATDAALGLEQEKTMSTRQAFWYYRKAVMWSVMICKSPQAHMHLSHD